MPIPRAPSPAFAHQRLFDSDNDSDSSSWGEAPAARSAPVSFSDGFQMLWRAIGGSLMAGGAARDEPPLASSSDLSDSDDSEDSRDFSAADRAAASDLPSLESSIGIKRSTREYSHDAVDGSDDSELQCMICTKLAEDAVQTQCCGTLHCRACITRWLSGPSSRSSCAFCRASISASGLITDVRAERESSAAVRRCCFAEQGCGATGNRKEMLQHEKHCDRVPVGVLRKRLDELERRDSRWKTKYCRLKASSRQVERHRDAEIRSLQQQRRAEQLQVKDLSASNEDISAKSQLNLNWANSFLNCCLRSNSGAEAMKLLHNLPSDSRVCQVQRRLCQERFASVFDVFSTDVFVKECNYNVCVVFKRRPGITICPAEHLCVTLLHPYNPKMNVAARVSRERWLSMRRGDCITVENVVTSARFDDYCVDGRFHVSHSGGHQRCDRYACHCGVQLSRACHHVCREEAMRQEKY